MKNKQPTLGLNIHFSENEPLYFPSLEVAQSNQLATSGLLNYLSNSAIPEATLNVTIPQPLFVFVFYLHTKLVHL